MLSSETPEKLTEIIESLSACSAVCEQRDTGQIYFIAANQAFLDLTGIRDLSQPTKHSLDFLTQHMVSRTGQKINFAAILMPKLEASFTGSAPCSFEQPFDINGRTIWWRVLVQPIRRAEPEHARRLMVTCFDVSDEARARERRATRRRRYYSVIESAHEGIITIDSNGDILVFNKAAEEIFGYAKKEVLGQSLDMLIPESARDLHAHHVDQFAKSAIQHRAMFERGNLKGVRKDGTEFPLEVSISKIGVDGKQEYTAMVRDISKQAAMIDELRIRAATDPLTGLKNRRFLQERCIELQALADRHAHPISVLIIDIDYFKRINDACGHAAGDRVLVALARTIEKMLRKSDIPARVGGEEFVIVMPETPLDMALSVAERLRTAFAEGKVEYMQGETPIPFTVSIGAALYNNEMHATLGETIKLADAALYHAKEMGRNRVACANSESDMRLAAP